MHGWESARDHGGRRLGPRPTADCFIDSPTVACYQLDPAQRGCYVNWHHIPIDAYLSVEGIPILVCEIGRKQTMKGRLDIDEPYTIHEPYSR